MLYQDIMARDFSRMYMPTHDIHTMQVSQSMHPPLPQQPDLSYHVSYHATYPIRGPNATPAPFEMTAGAGGGAEGALPPAQHQLQHLQQHAPPLHNTQVSPSMDQRKRKGHSLDWAAGCSTETEPYELPDTTEYIAPAPPQPRSHGSARKRRPSSSYGTNSTFDDDYCGDDARSSRTNPDKKQNHSEIEKRRRDKMNTYITELSSMIPMCGAMARKLDKLTVLRIAVQHLRVVRGALTACPLTARPTPNILSERELNALVLNAADDSFLMVVGCDRGRLLYVSASVKNMLHYNRAELLGQSLFDLLHPKDVAKVKEQLSASDLSPRERLIDAKTMLPLKTDVLSGAAASRLGPGARRSFFCRIKARLATARSRPLKEEQAGSSRKKSQDKKYCVVQCTGYLKSWLSSESTDPSCASSSSGPDNVCDDGDACNMSCLVAVARALPDLTPVEGKQTSAPPTHRSGPETRPLQFISRHATDGKYLFVDQRVTLALGFLPQELLGTSLYEYLRGPGVAAVACAHKQALLRDMSQMTPVYSFKKKDGTLAIVKTHFKPFRNPWTKDVECLVANNTILLDVAETMSDNNPDGPFDIFKQDFQELLDATGITESDTEMQRLIEMQVESQLESHKIGSAIAEEALRRSSPGFSPELPAELLQDVVFNQQQPILDTILCSDGQDYCEVRNNVLLNSTATASDSCEELHDIQNGDGSNPVSPPLLPLAIDGNGEAAMAVIMSLLEADAGLGGPVNFSGLPWPLP